MASLAVAAWAQSAGSASSPSTSTPASTGDTLRNPSTLNSNQQTAAPSGPGFGTRAGTSPSSTSPGQTSTTTGVNTSGTSTTTSADAAVSGSSNADLASRSSAGLNPFTALDADSDGRISINEFTANSTALGSQGSLGPSVNAGATTNTAPRTTTDITSPGASTSAPLARGQADPAGASSSTQRSPNAGFSGATAPGISTGGTVRGGNSAQLFHQLDTNSDGYLSRSELTASGQNTVTTP